MVRKRMKHNSGKFFLMTKTRLGIQYYQESGLFDAGTASQEPYLYWTKYCEYAYGFKTVKSARAMANKLLNVHKIRVWIVDRKGAVVA